MPSYPEIFARAMALPSGVYIDANRLDLNEKNTRLIGMDAHGITNATSWISAVGTFGGNPCPPIFAYNPATRTAGVLHVAVDEGLKAEFLKFALRLRASAEEPLKLHVMGASICRVQFDNAYRVKCMTDLLAGIEEAGNIELVTFDVYDKLKPHTVAIDARDGSLIQGSAYFTTQEEGINIGDRFRNVRNRTLGTNFDGTLPEFQLAQV